MPSSRDPVSLVLVFYWVYKALIKRHWIPVKKRPGMTRRWHRIRPDLDPGSRAYRDDGRWCFLASYDSLTIVLLPLQPLPN